MIERDGEVSVKRQAELLDLSRSSVYYVARGLPERDLKLMRILDELHLKWPFYGARKLTRELQNQSHEVVSICSELLFTTATACRTSTICSRRHASNRLYLPRLTATSCAGPVTPSVKHGAGAARK
jgi:hypothetical protein